jgi:hypothetical protein
MQPDPRTIGGAIVLRGTIDPAMTFGSSIQRDPVLTRPKPRGKVISRNGRRCLLLLSLGALTILSPVNLRSWGYADDTLTATRAIVPGSPAPIPASVDLEGDGTPETLSLSSGTLAILSDGSPRWQSPPTWLVRQAAFTDLNRDGRPEVSLLVWRDFQPWPTDRLLPHGGRIDSFHDARGQSCHLILIGPDGSGGYRELWAGSALAEPIISFTAADLDRDGRQELLTLENRYTDDPARSPGRELKVWEWNGFGFTVSAQVEATIARFVVIRSNASTQIVAQLGWTATN